MVNRTVKKLRAELKEAEESRRGWKRIVDDREQELAAERAKVEVLEQTNRENRNTISYSYRDLTDQVQWMRNLIEALTINPKTIYAKTDRDMKARKEERIRRELDIKLDRPMNEMPMEPLRCMHGQYPGVCREMPCKYKF